jgi:hypothetical protein
MDDMSSSQQAIFASQMADSGIVKAMVNAKRMNFVNEARDKNFKKYLGVLTNIEKEVKTSNATPAPSSPEARAMKALNDIREAFAQRENSSVSNAYRKAIEPEEIK